MKLFFLILLPILSFTSRALDDNLLLNGSFEQPGNDAVTNYYAYFSEGSSQIPGWTLGLKGVEYLNPNLDPFHIGEAYDGFYCLDLAPVLFIEGGSIEQTIDTEPGKTYDLTFVLGTS